MKKIIVLFLIAFGLYSQQVGIDIVHDYIHSGKSFTFSFLSNMGSGDNFDVMVITTNKMTYSHATFALRSTLKGRLFIFDTFVYTNAGTQKPFYNRNRASSRNALMKVYISPHVTNITTNSSSITNAIQAMSLYSIVGGGIAASRIGGDNNSRDEMIFQTNKAYLFRFVSDEASAVVTFSIDYYER